MRALRRPGGRTTQARRLPALEALQAAVQGPLVGRGWRDLRTGDWHREHGHLLGASALEVGYCTVTVDF